VPFADVVTTTTHKTLCGPRGGLILCKQELAKKIDSAVFPGQQGGPLEHVIAAKAVALKIAMSDAFRERQERTLAGARVIAERLQHGENPVAVWSGGTDVHLVVADLRDTPIDGREAQERLDQIGITANRNAVPFDPRPPMVSSGLRLGTPALATRGLQLPDFEELGDVIRVALGPDFESQRERLRARCAAIAERYPLYAFL
jgi:glycine hydroxymethyltransferase